SLSLSRRGEQSPVQSISSLVARLARSRRWGAPAGHGEPTLATHTCDRSSMRPDRRGPSHNLSHKVGEPWRCSEPGVWRRPAPDVFAFAITALADDPADAIASVPNSTLGWTGRAAVAAHGRPMPRSRLSGEQRGAHLRNHLRAGRQIRFLDLEDA